MSQPELALTEAERASLDHAAAIGREANLTATIARLQGEVADLAAKLIYREAELRQLRADAVAHADATDGACV